MTPYLSRKFTVMSAISILLVIYIHMFYTEGASMPALLAIENTVGRGLCQIAVPLFYLMSGYLFFARMPGGLRAIKGKLKKRAKTLLVPYLIANTLTFFFWLALSITASCIPAIERVVNFNVAKVIDEGLLPTLRLVFIDPPIAFQLWFVRDLMVVMLFSPVIYSFISAIRHFGKAAMAAAIAALVILYAVCARYPFVVAAFWFTLGGIASTTPGLVATPRASKLWAFFLSAAYITFALATGLGIIPNSIASYIPFVGIPAIWITYDVVAHRVNDCRLGKELTGYTFFVYLIHEPLLNIFKKLPLLASTSEPTLIISYLIIPLLFFPLACVFGKILKTCLPKFYAVYTGGR